jgi:hypothetical protein
MPPGDNTPKQKRLIIYQLKPLYNHHSYNHIK